MTTGASPIMQTVTFSVSPDLGPNGANDVMLGVAAWQEIKSVERLRGAQHNGFAYAAALRKGTPVKVVLDRLSATAGVLQAQLN
jgi:hypothetical protein